MTRIVRGLEGEAVLDLEGRLPGRGAYVCLSPDCLDGLKPSALSHTLKASTSLPDGQALRTLLVSKLEEKGRNLLTIGSKAGRVVVGSQAVREAIHKGRVELCILAGDAAARTAASLRSDAGTIPCRSFSSRTRLGHWLGKDTVAVVAVLDRGLSYRLTEILDRLTAIADHSYHENTNDLRGGLTT